jgi:hypothetical protein
MKQLTLAAAEFERYAKAIRRAVSLADMEQVVPSSALCSLIEPFYPKPGNGRPPVGVERMLRIYFLQQWFNLSDPAVDEALYDSPGDAGESPRRAAWRELRENLNKQLAIAIRDGKLVSQSRGILGHQPVWPKCHSEMLWPRLSTSIHLSHRVRLRSRGSLRSW